MDVKEAIQRRRAYRSFEKVEIDDATVRELAAAAQLAPSCFNNQPWRFVFVRSPAQLTELRKALSKGNEWIYNASMIIAVVTSRELDCVVKEREYYLFDVGMASAFIQLRATELGLVAHPVAGFNEDEAKRILEVPAEMRLITLINVGKHSLESGGLLSDNQKLAEQQRPPRKELSEFAFMDKYGQTG